MLARGCGVKFNINGTDYYGVVCHRHLDNTISVGCWDKRFVICQLRLPTDAVFPAVNTEIEEYLIKQSRDGGCCPMRCRPVDNVHPFNTLVRFTLNGTEVVARYLRSHSDHTASVEAVEGNPWMGARLKVQRALLSVVDISAVKTALARVIQ